MIGKADKFHSVVFADDGFIHSYKNWGITLHVHARSARPIGRS